MTTPEHHDAFARARLVSFMPALLAHSDAAVRARACNLLGNLCRHSDRLYPDLQQEGVIAQLITLCADHDRSTRKFACFAIGNAGFHNASLYSALRPAVAPLVALLTDEEDRTRANAAGALGNLLRNSAELVPDMMAAGALQALLALVAKASQGAPEAASSMQIAMFSLGNVAAHRECADALMALGVLNVVAKVEAASTDPTTKKYVNRIRQKLGAHAGAKKGRAPAVPVQQTPMR